MPLLEAKNLVGGYDGIDILKGVNLTTDKNEIVVIVGANGAGKSTVLKALFGLIKLRSGQVIFDGEDITRSSTNMLVEMGISFVPQERNIFSAMTVHENLEMGAFRKSTDCSRMIEQVFMLFPDLKEKAYQVAGQLSGGQKQMVAVGRALMAEPKLLLLDEPTAGLSPLMTEQFFDRITAINRNDIGVLLVEQNVRRALAIAHRGYVLATGRNRFEGTAKTLLDTPEIAQSFLGG